MKDNKKQGQFKSIIQFLNGRYGRNIFLFFEFLILVAYIAMPGLYYNPEVDYFWDRFYADSLIICGGLWVILVVLTISRWVPAPKTNRILTNLAGILTPLIAFFWLEFYNDMQFWAPMNRIPIWYLFLDFVVYYVVYAALVLLINNIKWASITMIFLTAVFGIMNYELTLFRGMSFIASDIFSALTAFSVANTYTLQIDVDTAEFLMLAIVLIAALLKLKAQKLFLWKSRLAYALFCVILWGGFVNVYVFSDYLEDIGVDFRVYRPQFKYRFYGTMLTTMRTFGYLHVKEPEGYSYQKVADLTKSLSQEYAAEPDIISRKKPNIIVVMNESFADLQTIGKMELTEDYMPFFRNLKENTIKGYTYSSVFGGNTANTEFEFLTGNTLGFLPDNSVPYQLFLREKTAGLTYTLKDQGYAPCDALHPYYNTGYSRYKVYPLMGFDRFFCSDDFSVFTPTVNYHITDAANYEKLIDIYENRSDKNAPFYMFNVTMQNHGSYNGSLLETGDRVRLKGDLQFYSRTNEFLNMMRMSDDALKELVQYFSGVDEPTVIVFFGDHQPDLDESFYERLLGRKLDEIEGEQLQRLYKVPFLIWANYDIEEKIVPRTSMNYLSTYLAQAAGIEKTDYLRFLTKMREEIPAINALGYWGADGKYYEIDDTTSPYYERIHQYHLLEYNNIFGKEDQISSFFYIQ